jgi:hypothetical protein
MRIAILIDTSMRMVFIMPGIGSTPAPLTVRNISLHR